MVSRCGPSALAQGQIERMQCVVAAVDQPAAQPARQLRIHEGISRGISRGQQLDAFGMRQPGGKVERGRDVFALEAAGRAQ